MAQALRTIWSVHSQLHMNMEIVRKQEEHSLLKIQMLIDELRSKWTNEELLEELQIESARAVDDMIRLIGDAERQKKASCPNFC